MAQEVKLTAILDCSQLKVLSGVSGQKVLGQVLMPSYKAGWKSEYQYRDGNLYDDGYLATKLVSEEFQTQENGSDAKPP